VVGVTQEGQITCSKKLGSGSLLAENLMDMVAVSLNMTAEEGLHTKERTEYSTFGHFQFIVAFNLWAFSKPLTPTC